MRKIAFFVLLAVAAAVFVPVAADAARRPSDREKKEVTRKEKADMCHGRIKIVNQGGDFLVSVSGYGADIGVKIVPAAGDASSPGRWKLVSTSPDWTVRIVPDGGDFSVRFEN